MWNVWFEDSLGYCVQCVLRKSQAQKVKIKAHKHHRTAVIFAADLYAHFFTSQVCREARERQEKNLSHWTTDLSLEAYIFYKGGFDYKEKSKV